jgi:hypothetical protein
MSEVIGALVGGAGVAWLACVIIGVVVWVAAMPFMALRAMHAIVGIRRELETVNLNLDEAVRVMRALAPPEDDRLARRFSAESGTRDAGAAVIR